MPQQRDAVELVLRGGVALRLGADVGQFQARERGESLRAVHARLPGVQRGLLADYARALSLAPLRGRLRKRGGVLGAASLAHGVRGDHHDLAAVGIVEQHGAYQLLEPALVHPGAQDVEQAADLEHRVRLAAAQPAVEHAEAQPQSLRVVAEVPLAHLELEVGHGGLQLLPVKPLAGHALEHGAQLFPGGDDVLLTYVAHFQLHEGLGAAVPDHHADRLAQAGREHFAREHGLVAAAQDGAEYLHGGHALPVGYLADDAPPGQAVAVVLVLLGGQLELHALRRCLHAFLKRGDGQALARLKAAEVLLVEDGQHVVYVHVAVEVDVGVGGGVEAAVVVQELLIAQLGDVLRVAAGDVAVGRVGVESAHDGVLLQLVRVGKGAAHLVVNHALAAERAVGVQLVVPALLAENLALCVYQRAEHGVEVDAHEV